MNNQDFAKNLKLLCRFEKSVSAACRAIGVNRQQFSTYLNAKSRPSPNNMQRICDHFSVHPSDLFLPHEEFADRMQFRANTPARSASDAHYAPLTAAFPGDRKSLRKYLGYYLVHFHSAAWPGHLLKAVTQLSEHNGVFSTKTIERARDPGDGTLFISKYDGQVSLLGNRLFIIEHQSLANDAIVETVLFPAPRTQLTLLRGVTFGLSSKQRNPYVAKCVWKYLGVNADLRKLLNATGLFEIDNRGVDPKILRIMGRQPFPNELLDFDDPLTMRDRS